MEFDNPYIVYVKTNSSGYITAVNSSAFLTDTTEWTEIDSGYGDKYHHAQGNYFPEVIMTMGGAYRYKLVDGKSVECTAEEIAEQEQANVPDTPSHTLESRVDTLETDSTEMKEALEMILNGVTE
jgi:hypothetical protein